jgi:hypothetical protein
LERLATDQSVDGEGAPKLVTALPSRPNWRQFDLALEELSEHLPSLRGVRAQQGCDVPDALPYREAQSGGVQALNLGKLLQFRQAHGHRRRRSRTVGGTHAWSSCATNLMFSTIWSLTYGPTSVTGTAVT